MEKVYCSYNEYSVVYDFDTDSFLVRGDKNVILSDVRIERFFFKNEEFDLSGFTEKSSSRSYDVGGNVLNIFYKRDTSPVETFTIKFTISKKGVLVHFIAHPECTVRFTGRISYGNDSFPMSSIENSSNMRCAIGPAASKIDNMLFDRESDSAASITGGKSFRMNYNWSESCYDFTLYTGIIEGERKFRVFIERDIMKNQYGIEYKPLNKNGVYAKPPSGWMTWYAVGFDANEKNVLENASWQSENLKKFGADTVWIDWEWYHSDYSGKREDGVNAFTPDPEKYPNGLKYVADKIKEMGLVPALWIGYTNDPSLPEYAKDNPEIILVDENSWCGTYYYDFSHPKYLNEFLPRALKKVIDWGYKVIKYDTLPNALGVHEAHHMDMYDPDLTTRDAYRLMVEKTRECLGEDCYMLSCAGTHETVLWAADMFDAARVGNDIFEWEEFIKEGVMRVMEYYPLHNIVLYNDPDNVILREKYNTYNQAASRIYFVTMLGLPLTFGDVFSEVPAERLELIKRCLPVMDVHPMDIKNHTHDDRVLTINLSIDKPYEQYNVVDIFNMQQEKAEYQLDFSGDLYLDKGCYHVYDYTNQEYLGFSDTKIMLSLEPCESRIICIRRKEEHPQVISTSRHITQGAAEIEAMLWDDEKSCLELSANLVEGDEYTITMYIPDGYEPAKCEEFELEKVQDNVYKYSIMPKECKKYEMRFYYERN